MLFNGHVKKHVSLFEIFEIALPVLNQILELAQFLLHLLGLGLIVPELRSQGLGFQPFYIKFFAV
jgi:hypothetical protein